MYPEPDGHDVRDRDRRKVSASLHPELHARFEAWRAARSLDRATALAQMVEAAVQESASTRLEGAASLSSREGTVGQAATQDCSPPGNGRDRARSLSANPPAVASTIASLEAVVNGPRSQEEMEMEEFLQSPIAHALLSKWACFRCHTPVDRNWTRCPVCGGFDVQKRENLDYAGFDEVMERWHNAREFGKA
jgi:rubrerythrin